MRRLSIAAVALTFVIGCGVGGGGAAADGAPADAAATDTAGADGAATGVKRVTLTGNYLMGLKGQGWNLDAGRIALDSADADFELTMTMVIMLFPNKPQVGFCKQMPAGGVGAFTRIEDVPSDVGGCTSWSSADLGGNSPAISNYIAGMGFIVRDDNAVPVAKVMTVSGSIVEANVQVTFDIVNL